MVKFKVGVIACNFDVIHPGYIQLFTEMATLCEEVVIFLQTDSTVERPEKNQTLLKRKGKNTNATVSSSNR